MLFRSNYVQISGSAAIIVFVTVLMPLAILKQPNANWFDTLADAPAVASPLETLKWLHAPDSPSLGKRMYYSETSLSTLRYGPQEYNMLTSLDGLTAKPMDPSGSNASGKHKFD